MDRFYNGIYKYTKLMHLEDALYNGIFASTLDSLNDPYEREYINYLDDFRVCCMTSSPRQMLMWSYYNGHRGCVIHYAIDNPSVEIRKVEYKKHFTSHREMDQNQIYESLYTKGDEWQKEKEIRAVFSRNRDSNLDWIEGEEKIFLKAKVKEVIFGVCSQYDDNYNNSLILLRDYNKSDQKVVVRKLIMSNKKYELVFDKQFDYLKELTMIEGGA